VRCQKTIVVYEKASEGRETGEKLRGGSDHQEKLNWELHEFHGGTGLWEKAAGEEAGAPASGMADGALSNQQPAGCPSTSRASACRVPGCHHSPILGPQSPRRLVSFGYAVPYVHGCRGHISLACFVLPSPGQRLGYFLECLLIRSIDTLRATPAFARRNQVDFVSTSDHGCWFWD
jgi:hypothetical protein